MIKLDCIAGESWKDGSSISEIKELGSEQIFQPRLVSTQNQNFSRISWIYIFDHMRDAFDLRIIQLLQSFYFIRNLISELGQQMCWPNFQRKLLPNEIYLI